MNKKLILTVLGLSAVLVGCQSTNGNEAINKNEVENKVNQTVNNVEESVDSAVEKIENKNADATLLEASDVTIVDLQTAFLKEYPEGEITSISLDNEDKKARFDIEGVEDEREVKIEVDAVTGEVVKTEKDDDIEDDPYVALDIVGVKDWKEAVQTALDAELAEGFKEFELKVRGDKTVYEVELPSVDKDVVLDAETLEII